MEDVFGLELSASEITYIGETLGMIPLPLLGDDSSSLAKRHHEKSSAIMNSLISRQYAQRQPDGSLALDQTMAGMVGATGAPDVVLTATCTRGEERRFIRQVYGSSGLLVEHEKRGDDIHCLTAVRDLAVLSARLREFLDLKTKSSADFAPLKFPEPLVKEALFVALVDGEVACEGFLQSEGISPASALQLARAFSYPACQSSLLAFRWEEGKAEPFGSLSFVRGRSGLWMLRPQADTDEPTIEVTPVDADAASLQVDEFLSSAFGPVSLANVEQVGQEKGAANGAD